MDKLQALHSFWSSFGWTAYDGKTIPENAQLPYITHELPYSNFGNVVAQTVTLWNRSTAWTSIISKLKEIMQVISRGGKIVPYDGGAMLIRFNSGEDIDDPNDDSIRGYVINYELEYLD